MFGGTWVPLTVLALSHRYPIDLQINIVHFKIILTSNI